MANAKTTSKVLGNNKGTVICGRCGGDGRRARANGWAGKAGGMCFECKGSGRVVVDAVAVAAAHRADVIARVKSILDSKAEILAKLSATSVEDERRYYAGLVRDERRIQVQLDRHDALGNAVDGDVVDRAWTALARLVERLPEEARS